MKEFKKLSAKEFELAQEWFKNGVSYLEIAARLQRDPRRRCFPELNAGAAGSTSGSSCASLILLGHPPAARDVPALGAAASMSRGCGRAMLALRIPRTEAAVRR